MDKAIFALYVSELQITDPYDNQLVQLSVYKDPSTGVLFSVDDNAVVFNKMPNPYVPGAELVLWPSKCIPFMIDWLTDKQGHTFEDLYSAADSFDLSTEKKLDDPYIELTDEDYENWSVDMGEFFEIPPGQLKEAREAWISIELDRKAGHIVAQEDREDNENS